MRGIKIIWKFFTDFTKEGNFNRISLFQILAQSIAGFLSFLLILLGCFYFFKSLIIYFITPNSEFYTLVKGLLSSFELYFMAPIPFLVIFSHRRNIRKAFSDILPPVQQKASLDLDEVKAKKGFISSVIGILSTFILGLFFELFSENTESESSIFKTNFWHGFIIICLLFLFLIILIFYYNLLSNHESEEERHLE